MLIANTKPQPLKDHQFAISCLGLAIRRLIFNDSLLAKLNINSNKLDKTITLAGCDHDTGKVSPPFQNYIHNKIESGIDYTPDGEDEFDINDPLHHETSLWLAAKKLETIDESEIYTDAYLYAIYWHHAEPIRELGYNWEKETCKYLKKFEVPIKDALEELGCPISEQQDLCKTIPYISDEEVFNFKKVGDYSATHSLDDLQKEFQTNQLKNIRNSLVRLCLILADRYVSSLTTDELSTLIAKGNYDDISNTLVSASREQLYEEIDDYIERTKEADPHRHALQEEAATGLSEYDHMTCNGPPSVGKTRIALMTALMRRKKCGIAAPIMWIGPRIEVCKGMFRELSTCMPNVSMMLKTGQECLARYGGVAVEPEQLETYDIVITTIDQVLKHVITFATPEITHFYLSASVVFDEFHELFEQPAFIPFFHELVMFKYLQPEQNITLISGTINPLGLSLFPIEFQEPVNCQSLNSTTFNVSVQEVPFSELGKPELELPEKSICITNLARSAQLAALSDINPLTIPFHSYYTDKDRNQLFELLMEQCGPSQTESNAGVIAGPVAQASLNISRRPGFTEISTPEATMQKNGRVSRFGEASSTELTMFMDPERLRKEKGLPYVKCKVFKDTGVETLVGAFYKYLAFIVYQLLEMSTNDLAALYQNFYDLLLGRQRYLSHNELLMASLKIVSDFLKLSDEDVTNYRCQAQKAIASIEQPTVDNIIEIWFTLLQKKQTSKKIKACSEQLQSIKKIAHELRIAGTITLKKILTIGAEAQNKNDFFAPKKRLIKNKNMQKARICYRGTSLYVTAPIITFHFNADRQFVRLGFDGYTHETGEKMTLSPSRIKGDDSLEQLNKIMLKRKKPKLYDHHAKSFQYGNKKLTIMDRMYFDAMDNPEKPFWLSTVEEGADGNDILSSLHTPGFIYIKTKIGSTYLNRSGCSK